MIELNKNEKQIWDSPWEMYYECDGKEYELVEFDLTNQRIRAQYNKKISFFKKEPVYIFIPLQTISITKGNLSVFLRDGEDSVSLIITTAKQTYTFFIGGESMRSCIKNYNKFIDILKKNVISIDPFPIIPRVPQAPRPKHTVTCPACGAHNDVAEGTHPSCDYCGTTL